MATAGMGLNLTLNVSGNGEQKLRLIVEHVNRATKATEKLSEAQAHGSSTALRQAASLALLGHELNRLSHTFFGLSKTGLGFFQEMIKSGADLQRAHQGLKIFFGNKAESMAGAIMNIASETEIAEPKLSDIARRLGSMGLNSEQATRGTRILANALSTLPVERQTRVLNSMGTTLQTANGLQRVFALELTKAQKAQLQNLDGHARTIKVLDILNARLGNTSKILSGGLVFQWHQFDNLLRKNIIPSVAMPAINALSESFGKLVFQLIKFTETEEFQLRVIKPLSEAFLNLTKPIIKLIDYLTEHNTIPKILEWLGDHSTLVEMTALATIIGTGMVGAFLSLAAAIFVATASMKLFRSVTLPEIKDMVKPKVGKGATSVFKPSVGDAFQKGAPSRIFAAGGGGGAETQILNPKFLAIKGVLTDMLGLLSGVGEAFLAVGGFIMTAASAAGVFLGMFQVAKTPALDFFKTLITGIKDAVDGMMQVVQTGSISEALFVKLNDSGFGPMFRVITFIALRLKEMFEVGMQIGQTMGPDIAQSFDVLKFVFMDIFNVVLRVMEGLGMIDSAADATGKGLGVAFGTILVGALKTVLVIVEGIALAIDVISRVVGGMIELVGVGVHLVLQQAALAMAIITKLNPKASKEEVKNWMDIAKSEGKESLDGITHGIRTMAGTGNQTSSPVVAGAPRPGDAVRIDNHLYINGQLVSDVMEQQQRQDKHAGGSR